MATYALFENAAGEWEEQPVADEFVGFGLRLERGGPPWSQRWRKVVTVPLPEVDVVGEGVGMVDIRDWRAKVMRDLTDAIYEPAALDLPQDQQDTIEEIVERTGRELCGVVGHEATRDQCNRPEHDFCLWCLEPMPGQYVPPGRPGRDGS